MRRIAFVSSSLLLLAVLGLGIAGCRRDPPATDATMPPSDSTPFVDSNVPAVDSNFPTDSGTSALCVGITPVAGTPALGLELIATVNNPVDIEGPVGDVTRLFVVEMQGRVRLIDLTTSTLQPASFLDIESIVDFDGGEAGLLGIALHPDYTTNGRFFVYYTGNGGSDNIIAEYARSAGDPNLANASATAIIFTMPTEQSNHNGGGMEFGPDGLLYVGSGDGGNQGDPDGDARDLNNPLGKVLRFDVDVASPYIPASNPYVGGGGAAEVFAYGFRNPWRLSIDRATGDLYIGDVGQDAWEEVTVAPAPGRGIGGDFGWNDCEGNAPFNAGCGNDISPAVVYSHSVGTAVIGGYVYRGCRMPGYHGTYFYGENTYGWVSSFVWSGGAATALTDWPSLDQGAYSVSSFGEDARGEIYITDLVAGSISRIVPQ